MRTIVEVPREPYPYNPNSNSYSRIFSSQKPVFIITKVFEYMKLHDLKCEISDKYTKIVFEAENRPDKDNLYLNEDKKEPEETK